MRLLRSFPIIVIVMVMLGIVGLCIAQKTIPLLLFAATLAMVSWYVTEGPRGRTIPKWASNLLALAVAVGAIADLLLTPNDVLDVLGRFSVGLTLIKLYERRTARDHAHLMGLSLLLILISCIRTRELLFGLVLAVYAGLGLYALLLLQLYAAHEQETTSRRAARPTAGSRERQWEHAAVFTSPRAVAMEGRPTTGRRFGLHFRALALAIGAAGLGLSLVVFVIFPRSVGYGMFSTPLGSRVSGRVTGYTDAIDLYAGTRITESRRVVGDVRLLDGLGRPVPRGEPLLLRGAALDHYDDDGRWSARRGSTVRIQTNGVARAPLGLTGPEGRGVVTQHFRFPGGTTTIFALYAPVAIETDRPARVRFDRANQQLRAADPPELREYTVYSQAPPSEAVAASLAREDEPRGKGGAGGDRVRRFAQQRVEEAGLPLAPPAPPERWRWNERVARVLADHLSSGPYEYTLDVSGIVRERGDPVEEFLFRSRRGHCEFFASALALMCRSVGVEARVVTGYAATDYDEGDDRYVVLESNAHAWVEVRTGAHRFVPIDPTPPGVLETATASESVLAQRLGRLYQRLESSWTSRVIEFDDRSQQALLGSFSAAWMNRTREAYRSARSWMARVNRAFSLGFAGYIWLGIVALVVIIALVALATVLLRRLAIRRALRVERLGFAESRRLVRTLGFYVDMLRVLREGGFAKPTWQPPLAFSRRLRAARPEAARLVRDITETYYRARYAGRRLTPKERDRAGRRVAELAAVLGAIAMTIPIEDDEPFGAGGGQEQIEELARLLGGAPRRVLDLGCGAGRVLVPLAEMGHALLGIDRSAAALERCRGRLAAARCEAELREADMLAPWPLDPRSCDAVLCLGNTFMLLADVDAAVELLRQAARVLRAGGIFVMDDCPSDFWPELTEGNWLSGVSEDGATQLVWHPSDAVFALRKDSAVDERLWELDPRDRTFRLWTDGALRLAARAAGLSAPVRRGASHLLLMRRGP